MKTTAIQVDNLFLTIWFLSGLAGGRRRAVVRRDGSGRTVAIINANGGRTTNFYDPADRRIALQDPRTNRTSFAYDKAGQQIRTQNPLGFITTTVCDPAGQQDPRNAEAVAALTTLQDSAQMKLD